MATSTFDKVFVVSKKADRERLEKILASDNPVSDVYTYTQDDWDRSEAMFLQCLTYRNRDCDLPFA